MTTVRDARLHDLDAFVAIYNHYVTTTHFSFDTEPYTAVTRRPWFDQFDGRRHRCLALEDGPAVIGYACSAPLKSKAAYDTSVEVSIYLAPSATGRRRAEPLYEVLFTKLSHEDVHRAYALIALPNDASMAFHRRFSFKEVAHLNEVGRKFGRYWDVAWLEKAL
jgi:phosphinothricin acetyltransferase